MEKIEITGVSITNPLGNNKKSVFSLESNKKTYVIIAKDQLCKIVNQYVVSGLYFKVSGQLDHNIIIADKIEYILSK